VSEGNRTLVCNREDFSVEISHESSIKPTCESSKLKTNRGCPKGSLLLFLLGDIARLTWRAVDFENDHLAFTTGKTGRRIILPLAKPLRFYLETIPSSDDPNAPIFPHASKAKTVGHLSNGFRSILEEAGLVEARKANHASVGKGRATKREVSELSFHSLRHSAVTFLKSSGASDVLAREIVGHDSAAISRSYTHLATEDLRPAIDNLPDITA
jgi:integrase